MRISVTAGGLLLVVAHLVCSCSHATIYADPEREVEGALEDLQDERLRTRYWATIILERYPEAAAIGLPRLAVALEDPQWPVRLGAIRAIESISLAEACDDSCPSIITLLADPISEVRTAAAFAVARISSPVPELRPVLEAGLSSKGSTERVAFGAALSQLFPDGIEPATRRLLVSTAVELFMAELQEEDTPDAPAEPKVRPLANTDGCTGLNSLALDTMLESDYPTVTSMRLGVAIADLDPNAAFSLVPLLCSLFEEGSYGSRYVGEAIGPALVEFQPRLMRSLASGRPEQRRMAAMAIGLLGFSDAKSVELLAAALTETDDIALSAARSIGLLGPSARAAIPALNEVVQSSRSGEIRERAFGALVSIDVDEATRLAHSLEATEPALAAEFLRWAVLSQF